MILVPYNLVAVAETDSIGGGKNVFPNASVNITTSTGGAAQIYSDETGLSLITLPTTCDSSGELNFFIESGDYFFIIEGKSYRVQIERPNPYVIENVADISLLAAIPGRVYELKEYHAGSGKGGGSLVAKSGIITPNTVTTFASATVAVYLERINVGMLFAEMGGAIGDGSTNDHLPIQRCIDVLMNNGGGNLYFEPKTYKINAAIDIFSDNIVLIGSGGNQPHDGGDYTAKGTRFLWGGGNNYMFNFFTPNTPTASRVTGVGIKDAWFICNAVALGGLMAISIRRGIFENLYVVDPVYCSYHLSSWTSTGKPESMDLQACVFSRCTFRAIDSVAVENAHGFLLTSQNLSTDTANVSLNEFHMCSGQVKNGNAWIIENADNNSFYTCSARVTGTGKALAIDGYTTAADSNIFYNFAGPSIRIRGTASGLAHNPKINTFINTDEGNGTPYPTMDAGCMVNWHGLINGYRKEFGVQMAITDGTHSAVSERDLLTTETLRIRNNSNNHAVFTDGASMWAVNIDSGTGDFRFIRVSGSGAINLGNGVDALIAGLRVTARTSAPTTGTWQRGSICNNSQPAVGSPKRWLCTVTGTPGTWVSEGNL